MVRLTSAILALCGLAAGGAGCVHYQPKPLSAGENAARLESRTLDNPELKQVLERELHRTFTAWPLKSWDFQALELAAYFYQPSLELARAQRNITRAEINTAGARPNPTVSVVPEYDLSAANGVPPWIPGVTFDLPIQTAGKRNRRLELARQRDRAALLKQMSTAWQVRSSLRANLLEFAASQRKEELLEKQKAILTELLQLLQQRFDLGLISSPEVTPTQILLDRSEIDLGDTRQRMAEARAAVAQAMGLPLRALDGLELTFDLAIPPAAAEQLTGPEARDLALRRRADLLGALADYAGTEAALQLQIAKQYPDVHFGPGYLWDQGDHKWAMGLSAELPVLNRNQGPIAEARARREEAGVRFTAMQAGVIGEIDRAVASYRAAQKQLTAAENLMLAQKKQALAAEELFQAGAADRLELLNARFELAAAELARLDRTTRVQQAIGLLETALQKPSRSMESFVSQADAARPEIKENKK